MNGKLSSLSSPVYFVNAKDPNYPVGYHVLAPYSEMPAPYGWERRVADTLGDVDKLQDVLLQQEKRRWSRELLHDEVAFGTLRDKVRDTLYARMTSSDCPEYEKEFIRNYLKLRIDKRTRHRNNFEHRTLFLHAREFDTAKGRKDNEESVNLDRLEVKL